MKRHLATLAALALSIPLVAVPSSARATGPDCVPIAVPKIAARSALPAGQVTCSGVRPGAVVLTSIGLCTQNFLFKGSDGYYVGTAGHCILDGGIQGMDVGERTWAAGKGPVATDAAGKQIGRFAYAVLQYPKDFALIRLDRGVRASAEMCYFGGPIGVNSATSGLTTLHYFGNGALVGNIAPARSAIATLVDSPDHVYAWGAVIPGDSGGPLIDDAGRAIGVVVTTGAHAGDNIMDTGLMGATRLAPQVARAAYKLRVQYRVKAFSLSLRTAPFSSDVTVP